MSKHVFISYGRRDATAFVERLRLELAAAGHAVFIDRTGLSAGQAWDEGLAEAIDTAKAVIAVLSPHAVRRAADPGNAEGLDSVCLDEIARARVAGRRVVPVMIERCEVPLPITRLNYIDLVGWNGHAALFRAGMDALLAALGDGAVAEPGPAAWDSASVLAAKAQDFLGRDWLFDQVADWAVAADVTALLVLGPPGVGKSAFAAELMRRDGGRRVVAHHLFQSETPATRDPGRFVRSLAAQLGRAVPGYAAAVRAPETARLLSPAFCDADPASALEGAVFAPLASLAPPDGGARLIVLDALDEALSTGADRQGRAVPELLAPRLERLPSWLRVLATSRPDPAALRGFERARRLRLDEGDERNRADLDAWLGQRLPELAARRLGRLANGSFLYARLAVEALGRADLGFDLEGLPPGLTSLFSRFFQRSFRTEEAYAPARRVLSVMLMARQPLAEPALADITGLSPAVARGVFDVLAPYLSRIGSGLALHHKALADWLTDARGGDPLFLVDRAEGARLLLEWCRGWATGPGGGYQARHFAAHLASAGQVVELRALLDGGAFHTARAAWGEDSFAIAADWGELAAALLATGDDFGAAGLAVTVDAVRRDAVVAAITRADLPARRLLPVLSAMQGRGVAGQSARVAALRLAAGAGLSGPLLDAVRSGDPALVAVAVPEIYRLWRDYPEEGWVAFERILASIPNWAGLPHGGAVEVSAGVSFAILTRELADAAALARLSAGWRAVVHTLQRGMVARLLGKGWVRAPLKPLLRALMARQPDYQPLNYAELCTAFARPTEAHDPALEIVACLEDPARGAMTIAAVLTRPGLLFDVHLMLAAERTLIRLGADDPAGVLDTLSRLMAEGPVWFRQSILYAGFHVLMGVSDPPAKWLSRYADWAYATIGPDRATLRTDTRAYQLVPHMAWPEVVLHRHGQAAEGRFIADWLAQAAALGDADFARRALGAAEVLSFVYRLDGLALEALRGAIMRDDPALREDLVRALANIRFNAGGLVDAFLERIGRQDLRSRVAVTAPTLSMRDFPTWIDAFFNHLLVTNDAFRAEVVEVFRHTARARGVEELLSIVVDWVVHLLEAPATPAGTRKPGAGRDAA